MRRRTLFSRWVLMYYAEVVSLMGLPRIVHEQLPRVRYVARVLIFRRSGKRQVGAKPALFTSSITSV